MRALATFFCHINVRCSIKRNATPILDILKVPRLKWQPVGWEWEVASSIHIKNQKIKIKEEEEEEEEEEELSFAI